MRGFKTTSKQAKALPLTARRGVLDETGFSENKLNFERMIFMALVKNATYRLENRADGRRSLNVYGNSPSVLANVCLWDSKDSDICQQWIYKEEGDHKYFVCKGDPSLALDLFTGPSSTANVKNYNAHVYGPSETSYVEIEDISGGYIRIKSTYNNRYLTANQYKNGTGTGKDVNADGNVYFYNGGLTDRSQDWEAIQLDGATPDPNPPENFPTKQYLIPPFPYTGVTADFGTDCEQIAAAQEAGKTVCSLYPYTFHYGTDLIGKDKNSKGVFVGIRNIRSSGYGEVVSVRNPDNPEKVALGRTVLVKYPNAAYGSGASKRDIYFLYCHLESTAVSSGQKVFPGDLIGVEGNSGYGAVAIHLHLEAYTSKITTSATEGGSISAVDSAIYFFNKTQEDDSYGYGRSTIVPDCDSPFGAAAYCDGTPDKCTHSNNLYFYNVAKIRGRGNFRNPTF